MVGKIVIFSAFLYSLSFLWMDVCWVLMIPALIMLVALLMCNSTALHGLAWGLIVYGVNTGVLMYSVYQIRQSFLLVVGWLVITLYLSLYVSSLFFFVSALRKRMRSKLFCALLSVVGLASCFFIIDQHSFFIFGVKGGYCLAHPLLPLVYGVKKYFCAEVNHPEWVNQVVIIRTSYVPCAPVDTQKLLNAFVDECQGQLSRNFGLALVVAPESAFPIALNKNSRLFRGVADNSIGVNCIIGGFFEDDEHKIYNGFYWFSDGVYKHFVAKQHAIPFVEMMPRWCDFSCVRHLFLDECSECTPETDSFRMTYELLPGHFFYPLICSEVFCAGMISRVPKGAIALVLVNDGWFVSPMLWRAAYLHVLMQAWWHKVSLMYVSYKYDFCRIIF